MDAAESRRHRGCAAISGDCRRFGHSWRRVPGAGRLAARRPASRRSASEAFPWTQRSASSRTGPVGFEALEAERSSDAGSDLSTIEHKTILPARWRGIRRRQESLENAHHVGARVTLLLAVCFGMLTVGPLAASNLRSRLSCGPRIRLRGRAMSITGTEPLQRATIHVGLRVAISSTDVST